MTPASEIKRIRQRVHDIGNGVINLDKEMAITRQGMAHRFENMARVESEQNETIKQLHLDIKQVSADLRTIREEEIRRQGAKGVFDFLKRNWMQLLILVCGIFIFVDEQKILHFLK